MSRRDRREARRAERRGRKAARKESRGGSGFQRRTARKAARAEKQQTRRDSRMQARQGRVDARKARGLARIEAKSESGFWSPEAVQSRQSTLGGIVDVGGDLLGGILGSGDTAEQAWDEAGYSDAAAFDAAYPDEYMDEMGEVIPFGGGNSDEDEYPWGWIAAAGGVGLVAVYMMSRTTKRGDRRKTARRAYMR